MSYKINPFTGALEQKVKLPGFLSTSTTSTKSSDYTANSNESVPCNTSGGSFTITLPRSAKDTIRVYDAVATNINEGFGVNPLTIRPGIGTTVMGGETYELRVGGTYVTFQLIEDDWKIADVSYPTQPHTSGRVYWVDPNGDDDNTGQLPSDPLRTVTRALELITLRREQSPEPEVGYCIKLRAGTYIESAPLVVPRRVSIMADSLRVTEIRPTSFTKNNHLLLVDSDVKLSGLTFAGHQAGSFAVSFNPNADNTDIGAFGPGAYILKSPYIQNCTSYTARDDDGVAGSLSEGRTGGGIEVDGAKCAPNSPVRSMIIDSFTQVNLDGPGCLVRNDGYAQLVSFFSTFCTYHVKAQSGGQVNLSGGGTTDFGTYGLIADGYSAKPIFTGLARTEAFGSVYKEQSITIATATTFSSGTVDTPHGLIAGDRVQFRLTDSGALPAGILPSTDYYVSSTNLTATQFSVAASPGGSVISMTGDLSVTLEFIQQGDTNVDIIGFSDSRLATTIGSKASPNAGQLFFPRLTFPRDAATKAPISKVFGYTRVNDYLLSYSEAPSPEGRQESHIYVEGGNVIIDGIDYGVTGASYDAATGAVTIKTSSILPAGNGIVIVQGLEFICPTSVYTVTGAYPIDLNGNLVNEGELAHVGYRVFFFSNTNRALRYDLVEGQKIDFRNRSQIIAPSHTFEYVGSGTNYKALPINGGIPKPENRIIEENNGRVFSINTDEQGNFAVGSQFLVDGTTGTVTINTDQLNLSGLNFIGPFSRNGGISSVGVQLREVSNNSSLISSTGVADGNTVPTQVAVKTHLEDNYTPLSRTITVASGLTGSGSLASDLSIAFSQSTLTSLSKADTAIQPANFVDTSEVDFTVDSGTNLVSASLKTASIDRTKLSFSVTSSLDLADTAVQPAAIANFETTTQLNTRDTNNRNRTNHTGTQTASTISDFDVEVSNNTDVAANTSARHVAVTVVDSSEVNLTLTGQQISASLVAGSIDETKLDTSVNASLDLADSALQPGTIGVTVQGYNANTVIDANYVATENSYTTTEKNKLAGIEAGATADQTGAEIKTLYEAEADTNAYTDAEKTKLAGIANGAEVNVNADWNAVSGDSQIFNKPTLGTAAATDSTDYATAAQGALADSALQSADIASFETTTQLNTRDTNNRDRANHTGTQTAATISDLDTEISNNVDVAANTAVRHDAVTVLDSSEIDFTLTGQQISASLIAGSIDETKLDTSVNASLDLADSALQPGTIGVTVQGYNANTVIDSAYVHTDNNYTTTEKNKLAGIADGAEVNVNADWNAVSGDAQILNKPTLGTAAATNSTDYATAAQGALADSAVQPAAIANFETTTQLNTRDTNNRNRTNHTGTQTASTISDFDTEVSNNTDVAANTASRHVAVTVVDSSEIDLTLTGQQISASLVVGSIDETKLDTSVNASLDLADTSLQPGDIGVSVQGYSANTVIDASYVHTDNNYTTTEKNKLAGIESGATADQTANEILTAIKTVDGTGSGLDADTVDGLEATAFATATQGTLADSALQPGTIGVTVQSYNANTVIDSAYVHTDNNYTTAEKDKLAGIESGATADLTGAEIKSLYEAEVDTNAFTDGEKTKLAGIESGATADQTAAEILTAIKTVDGAGSGLDADTVDGLESTAFATAAQGSKADALYYQPTPTKTTTYSAISGEEVRCDTTGGAFTVSLPVTGRVRIIDVGGTSDTTGFGQHNLTLTPQPGDTIAGETDLVLDIGLTSITLVYIFGNWVVTDLNGAAFTTIDWGDITNKPSVVETTGDQTISGTKTFSTALILPNNSRINGVEHFYQTTKPTTRGDSSALVAGDRWWKTDDGTEWFWNGTYWLGDTLSVFTPIVSINASGDNFGRTSIIGGYNHYQILIKSIGFKGRKEPNSFNEFDYWIFTPQLSYGGGGIGVALGGSINGFTEFNSVPTYYACSYERRNINVVFPTANANVSVWAIYFNATKVGNPSSISFGYFVNYAYIYP